MESLERRELLAGIVMTDHEQLILELVNRARANPTAEAARFGIDLNQGLAAGTISTTPKEPLAPNQSLINAARLHSQDMLDRDFFAHTNLSGQTASQRMTAAGYSGQSTGENIAWGGQFPTAVDPTAHAYERHESLFRSAGHRRNILRETFDELGVGYRTGVFTSGGTNWNASMVTENFGGSWSSQFITGVAYTDAVTPDNFYTVGEGVGALTVRAVASTGQIYETVTGASGGYRLEVPLGTYTVTFAGLGFTGQVVVPNVVVSSQNVKVDVDTTDATWSVPQPQITTEIRLDRDLGLTFNGSYSQNWGGWHEKWLLGEGGKWFFITPSGKLHEWLPTNFAASPEVTTLSQTVYQTPSLLFNAYDQALVENPGVSIPKSSANVIDSTLSLSLHASGDYLNWSGRGEKWLTSATGTWYTIQPTGDFYRWDVTGINPFTWLARLDPKFYALPATLASASFVTQATIDLDRTYSFRNDGQTFTNWGGLNEKWLGSNAGWFYLTPAGNLYRWHGGLMTNRTEIAVLDPMIYTMPTLLTTAFA